jgi:hypothetical protein
MLRRFSVTLLSIFLAVAATAQEPQDLERRVKALEEKLQQFQQTSETAELQREIDVLTREIESLKIRQTEKPVLADTQQYGLGAAASKVYRAQPGLSLGGYGEFLYQNLAARTDAGARVTARDNADALRAVLYAGYKFNDRILLNSEIEFEHGSTGAGGEASLEFGYLDFMVRPDTGIRAGLVLVPMGFINERHEPTAFLGSRRPLTERSIIPATWREMGVGAFGELGPISGRAYVVTGLNAARFSGSGIRSGRGNGAQSLAEDFALTGRVDWQPLVGTTVGASGYNGKSGQGAVVNNETLHARVALYDLHAEARLRGLWVRALLVRGTVDEAARINRLNNLSGASSVGKKFGGWYGELGYDIAALRRFGEQSLTPFMRYEQFDTQHSVPAGFGRNRANDQTLTTFGVQYKPLAQAVIKLDYQNVDNEAGTGTNQWNLALGYIF